MSHLCLNSSTISITNIIHSVPAIGQPFCFPINCDLSAIPPHLTDNTRTTNLYSFLCLGHIQTQFAIKILCYLTKDRQVLASHCANSSCNLEQCKARDLILATVTAHSSMSANRISKLSAWKCGPHKVSANKQHGECKVHHILCCPSQAIVKRGASNRCANATKIGSHQCWHTWHM